MSQNIKIIGVNNRNLKTFDISMDNSDELYNQLPQKCLKVAESGFQTSGDVIRLFKKGYDAFLIGERFMRTSDPGESASIFINELKNMVE